MTRRPFDPAAPDDPGALGPEARALLEAARGGDDPDPQDRARLRNAVRTAIAVSAAAPAAQAAAAAPAAQAARAAMAGGAARPAGVEGPSPAGGGAPPGPAGGDGVVPGDPPLADPGVGASGVEALGTPPSTGGLDSAAGAGGAISSAAAGATSSGAAGGGVATGGAVTVPGLSPGLFAGAGGKLAALVAGALAVGGGVAVLAGGEDAGPQEVAPAGPPAEPAGAPGAGSSGEGPSGETGGGSPVAEDPSEPPPTSPPAPAASLREDQAPGRPGAEASRPHPVRKRSPVVGRSSIEETRSTTGPTPGDGRASGDAEATDPDRGSTAHPAGGVLRREAAALEEVQRALVERRPSEALDRLDRLDDRIPDGQLEPERAFHRVLALCALDRIDDARSVARRLVARDAFYEARVRETCAAAGDR